MKEKVLIFGGDLRQYSLFRLLEKKRIPADLCGFDQKKEADTIKLETAIKEIHTYPWVILPVPYEQKGKIKMPYSCFEINAGQLFSRFQAGQHVYYGSTQSAPGGCAMYCNFLSQPDYVKKNADLTAHIACALLTAKYQVFPMEQKRILVCGYGRIGKELCRLLRNEGATVTAAARRPEVREEILAQCDGAVDIYDLETWIQNFDVIFNTVPSPVISRRELKHVNDHALLIELASYPYGIDLEEAANQKVTAFLEAGLPGKYMPDLEAEAMLYEIMKQEKGEGIWN